MVSPLLAAAVINGKYVNAIPLYRLGSAFQRYSLNLTRQNTTNWCICFSEEYLSVNKKSPPYKERKPLRLQKEIYVLETLGSWLDLQNPEKNLLHGTAKYKYFAIITRVNFSHPRKILADARITVYAFLSGAYNISVCIEKRKEIYVIYSHYIYSFLN